LGIHLEGYEYPYQVNFFNLKSQGQPLDMGYMYETSSVSNRKTVLLLHGKNFNGAYWGETVAKLLNEGFHVIVPDQIGFGKSSKPSYYHYTFQQLAHNTKSLMDHVGISEVIVIGHSMGGMLATRFALMYPELTTQLVLVNPIGLEDWKLKVPYTSIDERYKTELNRSFERTKSYMRESYFDGEWKEEFNEWVYLLTAPVKSPDFDRYAWNAALTSDMVFTQPVLYEFKNLDMHTTLIIGQRDRTAPGTHLVPDSVALTMGNYPELGKRTAEKIPDATLIELQDIGHLPHIEDFDLFIDELLPEIK